ncbi:MAG TPA: GTPase RsgA, partial [Nannocystis exedens]|nr:GTPase RsgA [Nannocystis exedens]
DDKGRHTTTHRELLPIDGGAGGMVIDTPGMRELQIWSEGASVRETFDDVLALAQGCRFRDCRHRSEPGCAVRRALQAGELSAARLAGFHKLVDAAVEQESARAASGRIASRRSSRLARADREESAES